MVTAGCDRGEAPTLWATSIVGINEAAPPESRLALGPRIECLRAPEQGRSGGGLFTADGQLAGICDYAFPTTDTGLYVMPDAIYAILERNNLISGLTTDYTADGAGMVALPVPVVASISKVWVDDYLQIVANARAAHAAGNDTAYKTAIAKLSIRLDQLIEERRAELKSLEAQRDNLRGTPDEIFTRVFGNAGNERPGFTGRSAPSPRRPADRTESATPRQAAKIHELEQQLDRLRLEIERLKSPAQP
jgi:hypothetical protein